MQQSTSMPLGTVEDALVQAMQEAVEVLEGPPAATTGVQQIAKLIHLLEALPLPSNLYCQAHGWLISAKQLASVGERGAALYQVRLICRRLVLNMES